MRRPGTVEEAGPWTGMRHPGTAEEAERKPAAGQPTCCLASAATAAGALDGQAKMPDGPNCFAESSGRMFGSTHF